MKHYTSSRDRASPRNTREDSPGTRSQLLTVGGQLFAEKGFDRTTGREICERAGVNTAAINYYFGGMEGLYETVLIEAHRRLVTLETLSGIVAAQTTAKAKLEAIIVLLVDALSGPSSSSWMLRVLGREIIAPSPFLATLPEREILPKIALVRGIVGELMGLPEEHSGVTRGVHSVFAPCFLLLISDRDTTKLLHPNFGFEQSDRADVVRHMLQFALGGLAAVAADAKGKL